MLPNGDKSAFCETGAFLLKFWRPGQARSNRQDLGKNPPLCERTTAAQFVFSEGEECPTDYWQIKIFEIFVRPSRVCAVART